MKVIFSTIRRRWVKLLAGVLQIQVIMFNKFIQSVVALIAMVYLTSCATLIQPNLDTEIATLKAGEYKVDPRHTSILFKVNHLGFAKYVGRFNDFEASLDFSPENFAQAKLSARVDMASVDVNAEKFENTLKGTSWFNVKNHPYASFQSTSAKLIGDKRAVFTGDMTFLGRTAPIDIEVIFNGGGVNLLTSSYTIGFEAHTTFKRSDYGLSKFIPAIGDDIELEIHAEFKRR